MRKKLARLLLKLANRIDPSLAISVEFQRIDEDALVTAIHDAKRRGRLA